MILSDKQPVLGITDQRLGARVDLDYVVTAADHNAVTQQLRDRVIFSAETTVNRDDFAITWNLALKAGGVLVSKEITITIDNETVLGA